MDDVRVYVSINNVITDISDGAPFEVLTISNLGASEATRITERGPRQDGDTDTDQVLEPRFMTLILQARPDDVAFTMRDCRDRLNRLFKATNVPIVLFFEYLSDGKKYAIDTRSVGNIDLPLNIVSKSYLKAAITLRAATPLFYAPETTIFNYGLSGGGQTLVPVTVPTFVGGSSLDQTTVIEYDGTFQVYPIILVYGPIANPKIENLTTGAKLDFNGFTIASGDYYTIDLRFGRKQVYKNGNPSDNRINELTIDSTIATFAIEADPTVPDGINTLRVTGSGVTGVSQVYLQYNSNFDGI